MSVLTYCFLLVTFLFPFRIGRKKGLGSSFGSIAAIAFCGLIFPIGLIFDLRIMDCEPPHCNLRFVAAILFVHLPVAYVCGLFFAGMGYFLGSELARD